jgi:hypothetical protein
MPFFDFSAPTESSIVKPRFWFYWVLAAPLTITTLALYALYTFLRERTRRDDERKVKSTAVKKDDLPSTKSNGKQTRQTPPRSSVFGFSTGLIPHRNSEARLPTTHVELGIRNGSKTYSDLMSETAKSRSACGK